MESREKCVPGQINVYLTDSERATNEEASIRENELSAGTLTNPRTQVTNQHSFRIRTRGGKGPYLLFTEIDLNTSSLLDKIMTKTKIMVKTSKSLNSLPAKALLQKEVAMLEGGSYY